MRGVGGLGPWGCTGWGQGLEGEPTWDLLEVRCQHLSVFLVWPEGLWLTVAQTPGKAWTPGGQENEDSSICQHIPNSPCLCTTLIRHGNPLCAFGTNAYAVLMINFLCQFRLGHGVSRYLVKQYSGCTYRVFGVNIYI